MQDNVEHNKANERKWDKWSKNFDKKGFRYLYFRYVQKKVISIANPRINSNFLDMGCGTGWVVCYAANLLKEQGNFVGVDLSEGMIAKAKENSRGLKNVTFYKASVEELPLENDYFDNIICTNSFHHYFNPKKVLSEVRRVLKHNGRIYIADPTTDDFIARWIDGIGRKFDKAHVKQYSTQEYKQMFSEAGLQIYKKQDNTVLSAKSSYR